MYPILERATLAPWLIEWPSRNACGWPLPTGKYMSTLTVWGPGGIPQRTKQGLGASANISNSITSPRCEYAWHTHLQTFIPTSGPHPRSHQGTMCPRHQLSHRASTPSSPSHLAMEHPPKADSHIRMTAEVWELLFHAILDTSSQACQGIHPEEANISSPGGLSPHESRRLLQASSYFFSGITMGNYAWHHQANHPACQGSLHSYYLTNQNSWGWHGHPPWGSDFTSRGDEQCHQVLTYNQGVHRCPSKETSIGLWDGPSMKTKLRPLRPLGRQRPIVDAAIREAETHHATTIREADAPLCHNYHGSRRSLCHWH